MGWFDEQIKQRTQSDQDVLEDSFFRMASVVMDKWNVERLEDERLVTRQAIDDILKYFRQKPVDIPEGITDLSGQLEYALRPAGLMIRDVELEDNWFSDAYGPMLGYMKDTNAAVALMLEEAGARALIVDAYSEMEFVSDEADVSDAFAYFSLLPYGGAAEGVTITGAKFPLAGARLAPSSSLGVSNEPLPGETAHIRVAAGRLLLVRVRRG